MPLQSSVIVFKTAKTRNLFGKTLKTGLYPSEGYRSMAWPSGKRDGIEHEDSVGSQRGRRRGQTGIFHFESGKCRSDPDALLCSAAPGCATRPNLRRRAPRMAL